MIRIDQPRGLVRARILPQEALDRSVLVFVSEKSTGLNPEQFQKSESYTLHGRGASTLRTEIVVEELLDAITNIKTQGIDRPYMILRHHPKETNKDLLGLAQEFDSTSNTGDPLELVYAADLVVGISTNLLNEAHLLGAKTLAVVPRVEEADWLPFVRNGEIPWVADRQNLREALIRLLSKCGTERLNGCSNLPFHEKASFDPLKHLIPIADKTHTSN